MSIDAPSKPITTWFLLAIGIFFLCKASQIIIGFSLIAFDALGENSSNLPSGINLVIIAVFVAPLFESLLLALTNYLFGRLAKGIFIVAALTSIALTALHGLSLSSVLVGPSFFFLAFALEQYRRWGDFWQGFLLITFVHVLLNLSSVLIERWT